MEWCFSCHLIVVCCSCVWVSAWLASSSGQICLKSAMADYSEGILCLALPLVVIRGKTIIPSILALARFFLANWVLENIRILVLVHSTTCVQIKPVSCAKAMCTRTRSASGYWSLVMNLLMYMLLWCTLQRLQMLQLHQHTTIHITILHTIAFDFEYYQHISIWQ